MNGLHRLLSHIALALALGTVLLVILDGFNPRMAFLTSTPSHVFLLLLCVCTAAVCLWNILRDRR